MAFFLFFSLGFANLCEHSTDFHFPPLNQQFEYVEQQLPQAAQIRAIRKIQAGEDCDAGDALSLHSSSSSNSGEEKVRFTKLLYHIALNFEQTRQELLNNICNMQALKGSLFFPHIKCQGLTLHNNTR